MLLQELVGRFEREAPISVMVRVGMEQVLDASQIDGIFDRVDHVQAADALKFSAVVDIMGLVAARMHRSVHAGYQAKVESIGVTAKAIYDKLQRVTASVSQALVRETAANMAAVIDATGAALPSLLPGYRVKILDGNHLRRTDRRLGVLRESNVAPLPGHALVVLDPSLKLVIDMFPCEDAHAQERTLLPKILSTVKARDLWIADRNFCTGNFLIGIHNRGAAFVIRQHKSSLRTELVGDRVCIGRCETGLLFEQKMRIFDSEDRMLEIRRVSIRLDQKTRNDDEEIHILTNLPDEIPPQVVTDLYRNRWKIETAFAEVAKNLDGEIRTLGYPKAALFAFAMALVVHNLLSVIQAALRAAHGMDTVEKGVSTYYMADEVAHSYRGLCIAVPAPYWTKRYAKLSPTTLAQELIRIAKQTKLARYKKHTRSSSKRTKSPPKVRRQHASTHRLLNQHPKLQALKENVLALQVKRAGPSPYPSPSSYPISAGCPSIRYCPGRRSPS